MKAAIKKMHFEKITHGSLAPENILVTKNEQEMQCQWNIHIISWKNSQDHRRLLMLQKANNGNIRKRSPRRTCKEKGRCRSLSKIGVYGKEEHGTDGYEAASLREWTLRRKALPRTPYGCKIRFAILKQQWDVAVEKDRKRLDHAVWNRY